MNSYGYRSETDSRANEADQRYERSDPHGEIIDDEELRAFEREVYGPYRLHKDGWYVLINKGEK